MSDMDIIKRALVEIGKEEYYDDVVEVYELTKKLYDKINEIDDRDVREAAFFASLSNQAHFVRIPKADLVSLLETLKFHVLMECLLKDEGMLRLLMGDDLGQD